MQSLINPDVPVQHVVGWNGKNPILETYPNSATICQIETESFPVALPFFWVNCPDNVVAYEFWYDLITKEFSLIQNVPMPQPVSIGTQTL